MGDGCSWPVGLSLDQAAPDIGSPWSKLWSRPVGHHIAYVPRALSAPGPIQEPTEHAPVSASEGQGDRCTSRHRTPPTYASYCCWSRAVLWSPVDLPPGLLCSVHPRPGGRISIRWEVTDRQGLRVCVCGGCLVGMSVCVSVCVSMMCVLVLGWWSWLFWHQHGGVGPSGVTFQVSS